MEEEELGFSGLLKEAIKIPCKNPIFIIFTFLTSLPLFFSLFIYETLFLQTLTEVITKVFLEKLHPHCFFCFRWELMELMDTLIGKISHNFLVLAISHLGILHFLDLINIVGTVNTASFLYTEQKALTLKEMFIKQLMDSRFKEPLITSVCVVLLTSLLSMGLLSIAVYAFMIQDYPLFVAIFVTMFVAVFIQYVKWSATWNLGTVISILEGKEGDEALLVSAYISRGNRRSGSLLILVCMVWRLCLRVVYLFMTFNGIGSKVLITIVHVGLICLANVFKWVAFVVYFNDCRRASSEKLVVSQSV